MALYYGTNAIVRSPDSDTDPFDISADIFSTLLWLDYLLKISLDHHKTVLRSKNQEVGATQKHTLRMQKNLSTYSPCLCRGYFSTC